MSEERFDVVVAGGGIAGNLLARQLRRALPGIRIALVEKSKKRSFKVGESSVEIACNYMIRRLGLSRYLYERQLPKNGLRFFFDTPERDAQLESMSEMGSVALPYLPSFQLDKARLEADLLEMNERDGVEVIRGKVARLKIAEPGQPHRFEIEPDGDKGSPIPASARWFCDASGRAGIIAKKLDLWVDDSHHIAAAWGRFTNVVDFDDIGTKEFRARANHTSRFLSTTHFCYPGYWIWFIPLSEGIISVGVVIRREQWDDAWRREDGFMKFMNEHRAVRELLAPAKCIDIMSYGQLAYGGKQFFDARRRWGLTGEAGAFTDPFYSPGSDYIAAENDFITDLIVRDLGGEAQEALDRRADLYDQYIRFRFETTMQLYRDQYSILGSYELYLLKWDFDIACYYNLWLEPFLRDQHLDEDFLRAQLRQRRLVNAVMKNFNLLFKKAEAHLHDTGRFYAKNLGHFKGDFPTMRCAEGLGSDASVKEAIPRTVEAFNLTRRRALALLDKGHGDDLPITHFLSGKSLF